MKPCFESRPMQDKNRCQRSTLGYRRGWRPRRCTASQKAGTSWSCATCSKRKPEAGKSYWMAFSNGGRVLRRGDRVDAVIGQFRVPRLVVE